VPSFDERNLRNHLGTLTLAQLRAYRKKNVLAPAQLAGYSDAMLEDYNNKLDVIDAAIERKQATATMKRYTFSYTISGTGKNGKPIVDKALYRMSFKSRSQAGAEKQLRTHYFSTVKVTIQSVTEGNTQ